jgi:hypothetical protein
MFLRNVPLKRKAESLSGDVGAVREHRHRLDICYFFGRLEHLGYEPGQCHRNPGYD